ncbi:MAG: hypothetical protein A3E79_19080 [Burkholderiales bacterium RIFCSPHIGHO2_12_FULL_61_11]|nr:MAG: hypothetical protein A3E79_19080 [Burkholderiales bacterium RIFCSPHIGHO2_12_FULL_61_11]
MQLIITDAWLSKSRAKPPKSIVAAAALPQLAAPGRAQASPIGAARYACRFGLNRPWAFRPG